MNQITGIDNLKKTVRRLSIHRSLTSIRVSINKEFLSKVNEIFLFLGNSIKFSY